MISDDQSLPAARRSRPALRQGYVALIRRRCGIDDQKIRYGLGLLVLGALGCAANAEPPVAPHPGVPVPDSRAAESQALELAVALVCDLVLEDFRTSTAGLFPEHWRPRDDADLDTVRAGLHYVVEASGTSKVLHAVYRDHTITIGRTVTGWDVERYPVLEWRWAAVHLPDGGNETIAAKNDTAAAVYAIWEVGFPMYVRGIKYAWSSELPRGARHQKRFDHDQLLVLQSGPAHLGQWRTERVNVRDHYQRFFQQDDVRAPDAIAVMTDADSTGGKAEAYFADFRLCRPGP